jgi:pimeloyl-ACP methyl ester carboxylesterase
MTSSLPYGVASRDVLIFGASLLALVLLVAMALAGWRCRAQALAWVQPVRTAGADTPPADTPPSTTGGWLTGSGDIRLRYWFVPGAGPGPRPAVVLLHGLQANRDSMLPRAAVLARHGFAALALELRGHGASGGDYTTLGDREVDDVSAALAYLTTRQDVDAGRVALLGHSLGAIIALRTAAARPGIRAVVAESAFVSVAAVAPAVIRALSGRAPMPSAKAVLWTMDRLTRSAPSGVRADDATRTLRLPVLFVHGARDALAPLDGARQLAGVAAAADLFVIDAAGHADLVESDPTGYEDRVTGFLARAL